MTPSSNILGHTWIWLQCFFFFLSQTQKKYVYNSLCVFFKQLHQYILHSTIEKKKNSKKYMMWVGSWAHSQRRPAGCTRGEEQGFLSGSPHLPHLGLPDTTAIFMQINHLNMQIWVTLEDTRNTDISKAKKKTWYSLILKDICQIFYTRRAACITTYTK